MKMTFPEFQRRLEWWKKNMPNEIRRMLRKAGMLVVAHSQKNYLTGPRPHKLGVISNTLRRSLHAKTSDKVRGGQIKLQIGTNVFYGKYHEYGLGTRLRARPFLRPAIADKRSRVLEMIGDGMMAGWRKSGR